MCALTTFLWIRPDRTDMTADKPVKRRKKNPVLGLGRRKMPRQERSEFTVQNILQATQQLAVANGFRSLNTRRVAARAGVSVGTLYHYFPTVEAILLAIYEEVAGRVTMKFRSMMLSVMHETMEIAGHKTLTLLLREYEANQLVLHRMPIEVPQLTLVPGAASLERLLGAGLRIYLMQFKQLTETDIRSAVFFLESTIVSSIRSFVETRPSMSKKQFLDDLIVLIISFMRAKYGDLRGLTDQS